MVVHASPTPSLNADSITSETVWSKEKTCTMHTMHLRCKEDGRRWSHPSFVVRSEGWDQCNALRRCTTAGKAKKMSETVGGGACETAVRRKENKGA